MGDFSKCEALTKAEYVFQSYLFYFYFCFQIHVCLPPPTVGNSMLYLKTQKKQKTSKAEKNGFHIDFLHSLLMSVAIQWL